MADKPRTDWEAIEREYRAGQLSVREIARKVGLTEGAIRKRAKAEGWERVLADKVRRAVREKLVRADGTQAQRTSDADVIEAAAETGRQVVVLHRRDIRVGREIVYRLFDELSAATSNLGEIEEAIEAETESDKSPQRRSAMLKAVSLPSRSSAMLSLAGALRHLVGLERKAFNLDDDDKPEEAGPIILYAEDKAL